MRFFQNEFGLKKLDILDELEGKKFKDLPPKAKSLLSNGQLRVNVIKKDSHEDIKYDIFMRLNKGAVTLNYQELRNCLYRGNLNDVAKRIVEENPNFLKILNLRQPHDRFLDVEFIIRFLSLYCNLKVDEKGNHIVEGYRGRMVTFINEFMKKMEKISIGEAEKLKDIFNNTIEKVVSVFGTDLAFRDLTSAKGKVNKALADCILLSFTKYDLNLLINKREDIVTALKNLLQDGNLLGDDSMSFADSISLRTSDRKILNGRINTWIKVLEDAIYV